jgi:hypothetical protein
VRGGVGVRDRDAATNCNLGGSRPSKCDLGTRSKVQWMTSRKNLILTGTSKGTSTGSRKGSREWFFEDFRRNFFFGYPLSVTLSRALSCDSRDTTP